MKTFLTTILAAVCYHVFKFSGYQMAENDDREIAIANALDGDVFELQQRERLFIPFGEYPHAKGLQKFDRQSGDLLVQTFNSLGAKIGRIFTPGVPIYKGHPDVPGRPDSDPSAPAMGWVQGIEIANDGVNLSVKWNPDGETAISNAHYRFYSPNWLLRPVKGGIQPVKLLSVGLTNNPRIPVPAIANDDDSANTMKLSAILRKLFGFAENDEPSDEQIDTAAATLQTRIGTLETAANDSQTQLTTVRGERDALQGQLSAAQTELGTVRVQLTAANDALTTARGARIDAELERLVESTRVEPANRDTLRTELLAIANDSDLGTRLAELHALQPKLKTKAVTGSLGKDKGQMKQAENDAAAASARREELVREELALIPANSALPASDRYQRAWNKAAAKHPTLFATAKQ